MMQNRKIKARNRRIVRWMGIGVSSLIIIWLSFSLINNNSPIHVLKSLWGEISGYSDDPMKMNKKALRQFVIKQNNTIDSLKSVLKECELKKGQMGIVQVDAPTLNMRDSPSLSSSIILRIPNNTEIIINYYDTKSYYLDGIQGQWCNITHLDQTGWVWGPYILKL